MKKMIMKHTKIFTQLLLLVSLLISSVSMAAFPPRLAFSDLISGPSTGLQDGIGSGVIITIWGQNLGDTQGQSDIVFIDANGNERSVKIYYWKRADGKLPSGPANLYHSHKMQEIAFSIPGVVDGGSTIQVRVNGSLSNPLNFTVRSGNIYHIMSSGDNSTGDGSFDKPWKTVKKALGTLIEPGSTIYLHNSIQPLSYQGSGGNAIYWNKRAAKSGYANQYAVIAFPNSQPFVESTNGIAGFRTTGMVVSKIFVKASACDDVNGQPVTTVNGVEKNCGKNNTTYGIQGTAYGRIVGNAITDRPGRCADGQQGAIMAVGRDPDGNVNVEGLKVFGNEIYDYGCPGTNKFHHTTYLSIRGGTANPSVDSWQVGWNYLHDNQAKNGLHNYDQAGSSGLCGSPQGDLIINDNVIVNQGGAGITVIASKCNTWRQDIKIYNNLLINVSLLAAWDGIDKDKADGPQTGAIAIGDRFDGLYGAVDIDHNTIYKWDDDDQQFTARSCLGLTGDGLHLKSINFSNNVCITDKDKKFLAGDVFASGNLDTQKAKISGINNVLYSSSPINPKVKAIEPNLNGTALYTNTISVDPGITINTGSLTVSIDNNSIIKGRSAVTFSQYDLYGILRGGNSEPGAVESVISPKPPTGLSIR